VTATATIELRGLELALDLGTYSARDVKPKAHRLDLTLHIDTRMVTIPSDSMQYVFDYDPLIARITAIAGQRHYHTQEYVIGLIASACAEEPAIKGADIFLYKTPVHADSGTLGVRLVLDSADLQKFRMG